MLSWKRRNESYFFFFSVGCHSVRQVRATAGHWALSQWSALVAVFGFRNAFLLLLTPLLTFFIVRWKHALLAQLPSAPTLNSPLGREKCTHSFMFELTLQQWNWALIYYYRPFSAKTWAHKQISSPSQWSQGPLWTWTLEGRRGRKKQEVVLGVKGHLRHSVA